MGRSSKKACREDGIKTCQEDGIQACQEVKVKTPPKDVQACTKHTGIKLVSVFLLEDFINHEEDLWSLCKGRRRLRSLRCSKCLNSLTSFSQASTEEGDGARIARELDMKLNENVEMERGGAEDEDEEDERIARKLDRELNAANEATRKRRARSSSVVSLLYEE